MSIDRPFSAFKRDCLRKKLEILRRKMMSRKIGIIGMGNVGAAVAHGAIAQGLADSYVL